MPTAPFSDSAWPVRQCVDYMLVCAVCCAASMACRRCAGVADALITYTADPNPNTNPNTDPNPNHVCGSVHEVQYKNRGVAEDARSSLDKR